MPQLLRERRIDMTTTIDKAKTGQHDSLNRHMDIRGFSGYEEMNAHMTRQWNEHVTKKDEVYIPKEDVKKQITIRHIEVKQTYAKRRKMRMII